MRVCVTCIYVCAHVCMLHVHVRMLCMFVYVMCVCACARVHVICVCVCYMCVHFCVRVYFRVCCGTCVEVRGQPAPPFRWSLICCHRSIAPDSFWASLLYLSLQTPGLYVGSRDKNSVLRLTGKALNPPSHLPKPNIFCIGF